MSEDKMAIRRANMVAEINARVSGIKVTPEMIAAGVSCMHEIDLGGYGEGDLERVITKAFRQMFSLYQVGEH